MQQLSSIIFPSYVRMSMLYSRIGSGYKLLPFSYWQTKNILNLELCFLFDVHEIQQENSNYIHDMNHENFHGNHVRNTVPNLAFIDAL